MLFYPHFPLSLLICLLRAIPITDAKKEKKTNVARNETVALSFFFIPLQSRQIATDLGLKRKVGKIKLQTNHVYIQSQ